jgi:hypothetical protein
MTGVYELKEWDRLINTYGPFPILLCDKERKVYSVNLLKNNRVEIRYELRTEEQMQYCQTSTMEINALAGLVANEKWEAKMNRLSGGGY